jgi:hypothetical protein
MTRIVIVMVAMLASISCTVVDPSHCGNRGGSAICRDLYEDAPVCDLCVATRNGCIETLLEASCPADAPGETTESGRTTSQAMTATDGDDAGSVGSASLTAGSASGTGGTSSETETETETETEAHTSTSTQTTDESTADDGETAASSSGVSSEEGPEEPVCGDGFITSPEDCDGDDLGGGTCTSFMGNNYRGELLCGPDCKYSGTECCRVAGASCLLPIDGVNQCCGSCKVLTPGSILGKCTAE